jgi:hypothetical protein
VSASRVAAFLNRALEGSSPRLSVPALSGMSPNAGDWPAHHPPFRKGRGSPDSDISIRVEVVPKQGLSARKSFR